MPGMAIAPSDLSVSRDTFDSTDPGSGVLVGTFGVDGPAEVLAAVARARTAAAWWQDLGCEGRARRLNAFKGILARGADEVCDLIHRENGKPHADAFTEVLLSLDHIAWAAGHAGRVLRPRRVPSGTLAMNHRAQVVYHPLGVVGVIGPWNYPLFTPMGSIIYALAAGNAVVFKPSEYTPAVGRWLADAFRTVVPEYPVLQVVTGYGPTGAALCAAGVDKLSFTGSAATGRRVMAACAENLTPVLLELGGNDAMVVDADADLDAAANAAVWGSLQNAGQACVSIERVYVHTAIYDRFVDKVALLASAVDAGSGEQAQIGPITMPRQVDVIARHLDDAIARGARAVVGSADAVHPPYVDPVVLVDVAPDSLILHEETFGPILPIVRVADADEAVAKANAGPYGLASAVFGKAHDDAIARRLRAGMTSVNSVVTFAMVPSLPFGGVGDSGFGRIHGPDGLKEFVRSQAITSQRFALPVELASFTRPARTLDVLKAVTRLRHGRR